ncbi:hypothetical protein GCM10017779_45580 [Streptomyces capillispiralis]|uniref:Uncharacterized protein n=1 Tax=Streptomyces capillispiralis TaxID=68182 RepID=A0A561TRP5_9ACTN|nr:hypothetical protein FHX78_116819 [Streptomyces capillispiralis]GHH94101.1 hypothetical protein GCM10017779_45580 [Streptomyces capillispiralis]
MVLSVTAAGIDRVVAFREHGLFELFGLPPTFAPAPGGPMG